MVWPMLLDMSRDDCKRVLRRLELEGYSAVLSAFRAQGDLSKEKKKILQDLQSILSISTERHRAEVRRAVNDEKFATIAHNISGANTTSEWLIEGRRLIPLMPRLVPQTAFTDAANRVANAQAEKNAMLPAPKNTAGRDVGPPIYSGSMSSVGVGTSTKMSRPSSPASNVVVLPSGASIHIKGVLHPDDEEEIQTRKRRRSQSSDSLSSVSTQTPRIAYSSTPQASHNTMSPVKITISKSPQGRGIPSTSHTQPPKVILVTSSGQSMTPTVIHKSISVPIVRASTATSTSMAGVNRGSIMMPNSPPVTLSSSNLVTVSSHSFTSPTSSVSSTSTLMGSPPVFQPSLAGKPRFRTIPRQRFPTQQHKPGVVIPMSSQPVHPSPQSLQNIQVKTITKPTIQIKQDGGMKIITQNIQGSSSKILPKPSHIGTSSSGTPVVVVNAGTGGQTSKVLNIATPGGRVITTSKPNVVTVNPKTLHLTAVKTSGGTTVSKPNVIVVQKTQQRRPQGTGHITGGKTSATVLSNPTAFEKELVTFIQKQEGHGTPSSGKIGERKVIITTASTGGQAKAATILQRSKSEGGETKSSLLAELIQAAGIVPDSSVDATGNPVGSNEWFEYDVTEEQAQALAAGGATDPATLQAILGMAGQDQGQGEIEDKSVVTEVIDLDQVIEESDHTPSNYYTLEQAMTLIEPGSGQTGTNDPPYTVTTQKMKETTAPAVIVQQNHPQLMPGITALREDKEITYQTALAAGPQPQFIGELDPETGLFYSGKKRTAAVASSSESSRNLDLIRSSLEEANIDLDTLQYVSEPSTSAAKVMAAIPSTTSTRGGNYNTEYGATIDLTEEDEQERASVPPKQTQERKETPPNVIIPISEVLPELASPSEIEATDAKPTAEDDDTAQVREDASAALVQKNADGAPVQEDAATVQEDASVAPVQEDAPVQIDANAAPVQENADAAPVQDDSSTTPTAEYADAVPVQEDSSTTPTAEDANAAPVQEDAGAETTVEASEAKDVPEEQEHIVPIYPEPDVSEPAMSIITSTTTQVIPQDPTTEGAGDSTAAAAEEPVSMTANVEPSSGDLQPITELEIPAKIPEVTQEAPLCVLPVIFPIERQAVVHAEAKDVVPAVVTKGEVTPVTKGEATPLIESQESTTEESFLMTSQSSIGSSSDSQGENDPSRPGKRKRKTPVSFDDSQSSSSSASSFTTYQAGWVRSAAGLLQKVCKYRGVNREKGELNASAWFIQPVDPNDAPDYYSIIKNPMDFGTIRKKLESGVYKEFEDFHNDMSLVKDNCFLYNPPTSPVRGDCTDVFNYYHTEAEKLREKWQKSHIGSPKKPRLDKSPGKS